MYVCNGNILNDKDIWERPKFPTMKEYCAVLKKRKLQREIEEKQKIEKEKKLLQEKAVLLEKELSEIKNKIQST